MTEQIGKTFISVEPNDNNLIMYISGNAVYRFPKDSKVSKIESKGKAKGILVKVKNKLTGYHYLFASESVHGIRATLIPVAKAFNLLKKDYKPFFKEYC